MPAHLNRLQLRVVILALQVVDEGRVRRLLRPHALPHNLWRVEAALGVCICDYVWWQLKTH